MQGIDVGYVTAYLQEADKATIHSVCEKAFELCQKAYLDKSNYQCRYNYTFGVPVGYLIIFDIVNKIDSSVLCTFRYNRQSGQLSKLEGD